MKRRSFFAIGAACALISLNVNAASNSMASELQNRLSAIPSNIQPLSSTQLLAANRKYKKKYKKRKGKSCWVNCKSRRIKINLSKQRLYAICDGKVIRTIRVSTGRKGKRTPTGCYTIFSKQGAGCRSSRYPKPHGGARMPYCMFFHRLYGIHGYHSVPSYPASAGCVRTPTSQARWLNHCFARTGTSVCISY